MRLALALLAVQLGFSQTILQQTYDARTHNFVATNGSGISSTSLTAGNNTVTFQSVPKGVNGSDSNHRVYVSGGVGTAESCLINGGSGSAGNQSGSIRINCAYSHSGAFSISSATGGLAEAQQSLVSAGGGIITINQSISMHAAVTSIPGVWVTWTSSAVGRFYVSRAADYTSGPLFYNPSSVWTFRDVNIIQGLGVSQTGAAIENNGGTVNAENVYISDGQYGFLFAGGNGNLTNCNYTQTDYSFQPVAAFYVGNAHGTTGLAGSIKMTGIYANGSNLNNSNEMIAGLYIKGADTLVVSGVFTSAQDGIRFDNSAAAQYNVNVSVSGTVIDNRINGVAFYGNSSVSSQIRLDLEIAGDSDGTTGTQGQGFGINIGNGSPSSLTHADFRGHVMTFRHSAIVVTAPSGISINFNQMNIYDNNQGNFASEGGILISAGSTGININGGSISGTKQQWALYTLGTVAGIITGVNMCGNSIGSAAFSAAFTGVVASNRCLNDGQTQANLASWVTLLQNGTIMYCNDCNSTCTSGSSTGQNCVKVNGAWTH